MLGGRPSWSTEKVVIQVSETLDFRQITYCGSGSATNQNLSFLLAKSLGTKH
jgi:hypothetical protein